MWNAGLDESQTGIKIAGRNVNNLRYADYATLTAESEEELKSLLMKVNEEREKTDLNSTSKNLRWWLPVPSFHGKWKGGKWKQQEVFFLGAPKSLQIGIAAMKFKDTCSLEENLWQTQIVY